MKKQTYFWQTDDKLKIYAVDWSIEHPDAVVCIIHGMGEHIERYNHVAAFFNEKNFAVLGYDRRGHGQSEGKLGHTPSFTAYLEEVNELLAQANQRYPNTRIILYGHSQGGNILLNYLIRRKPNVRAAIVTGPWIQLAFKPKKIMVFLGKVMKKIAPSFSQGSNLVAADISRDKDVVSAYVNDPLVHDRVTASTGMEMIEAANFLDIYSGDLPVPTLIMHGGSDRLTSQPASEAFADRVKNVTYIKWDNLYHEIHNEPEKEAVFNKIISWIGQH